jgi:serine protease Do
MRRTIWHPARQFLALSAVAVLLAVAACALAPLPPATGTTTTSPPQNSAVAATPQTNEQNPVLPDFVSVLAKVNPSVVAIRTEMVTYDIFNRPLTQEAAGSGWIYDDSGLIVTNNHVIQNAKDIAITLSDGRTVPASLVGADILSDLAVLRIKAPNLAKIALADPSELQVGDWVLSVGNSLGLGITAKEGIVSRIGVSLQISTAQEVDNLIETSAAINPGNSGGPLVNMRGEIIGINSIKIATSGVEGMGYAINIGAATPIIEELIQKGYVVRPWLGISVSDIDPFLQQQFNLAVDSGALVAQVAGGSPADKAGLKAGDVIVAFDSKQIKGAQDILQAISAAKIGDKVEITYWRGDSKRTTQATLTQSPPPK